MSAFLALSAQAYCAPCSADNTDRCEPIDALRTAATDPVEKDLLAAKHITPFIGGQARPDAAAEASRGAHSSSFDCTEAGRGQTTGGTGLHATPRRSKLGLAAALVIGGMRAAG